MSRITCTFLGTSSIYIRDENTRILIDGFLSRPSSDTVRNGKVNNDGERIQKVLDRIEVDKLDALFVAHSHFDHAMDAPKIVQRLGGKLYGSMSTLNIGRGQNLTEDLMQVIADKEMYAIGSFQIRILEGIHSPGNLFPGTIESPLQMPAQANRMLDGGCFSFHIVHPAGSILVHASANFVPDKFVGLEADIFYLSIGVLELQDENFKKDYWYHTVETVKPKLIIPIHWDDFTRELEKPLQPLPDQYGHFGRMREQLSLEFAKGWHIYWQDAFETVSLPRVAGDGEKQETMDGK